MAKEHIKTMVLLLLVSVNIFLLVLVLRHSAEQSKSQAFLEENLRSLATGKGLTFSWEDISWETMPSIQNTSLPETSGQDFATLVLGSAVEGVRVQAGTTYRNAQGYLTWYGDGSFFLHYDSPPAIGTKEEQAQRFLKTAQLSAIFQYEEEGLAYHQVWQGQRLLDCPIQFFYEDGRLTSVEGKIWLGNLEHLRSSQDSLDSATLLFLLISHWEGGAGHLGIEPAYRYVSTGLSKQASLLPVWLVSHGQDSYLLDMLTGDLRWYASY